MYQLLEKLAASFYREEPEKVAIIFIGTAVRTSEMHNGSHNAFHGDSNIFLVSVQNSWQRY